MFPWPRITALSRLERTKTIKSHHQPDLLNPIINPIPWCHIHTSLKYLQGWGPHHCPAQPLPVLGLPLPKEILPRVQPKPLLVLLETCVMRVPPSSSHPSRPSLNLLYTRSDSQGKQCHSHEEMLPVFRSVSRACVYVSHARGFRTSSPINCSA